MFSLAQKREIAAKVEAILLSYGHPEMPTEKPCFKLQVNGRNPAVSWADIEPNWTFDDIHKPGINPHNEMQVVRCNPPKTPTT